MKAWTAIISLLLLGVSSVYAATWVSYGYAYDYDYDYLRSDRTSREHRDAGDVDDWIERGNATVTASPLPGFEDGIRLSAWASGDEYDYDFALASAIYFFEIPEQAQYAEIKIRYRGDAEEPDFEDYEAISGRVWVRNLNKERTQRSYEEGDEDTLYGDSFVLRARRRSETIKIPTADHVKDGYMEVHLVVDGSGMLDVEYLDVSTYRRRPEIRVIHRYVRDYDWRPWTRYSYAYFYHGPSYYATDYDYYIMWDWPLYDHHYLAVRRSFQRYLMDYRRRYPHHYYYRPGTQVDVDVDVNVRVQGTRPVQQRRVRHLAKWTEDHQRTRELYVRTQETRSPSRSATQPPEVRTRVRSTIQTYRKKPVMAERTIRERPRRERITFERQRPTSRSRSSTGDRLRRTEVERSTLKRRTSTVRPDEQERRIRLLPRSSTFRSSSTTQQRSRVSPERSRVIESTRERREQLERRIKQRKSSSSSSRSSSSRRVTVKQRSTPPPSADEDDEDKDEKQQQRQRNTERTKRRK